MPRPSSYAMALLLVLAFRTGLWSHGTELIGAELTRNGDEVVLVFELSPLRLTLLTGGEQPPATWGDLRGRHGALVDRLRRSLRMRVGGVDTRPDEAGVRALSGRFPPADAMNLPDLVSVTVVWRRVPPGGIEVVGEFADTPVAVQLVITGVAVAAIVHADADPAAIVAPAAPETWPRMLGRALVIGILHIVPWGVDHILFVLGLYLTARRGRDLLALVTTFTVAHCATLGLTMAGVIVVDDAWGRLVEIAIAGSIVVVAVEACRGSTSPLAARCALVAAFGLVHGLGFAGALAEVRWPEGRFLPALVAANIGIEIGQLLVIGGAALATAWWWQRPWFRAAVTVPAGLAIAGVGLFWACQRALA